MRDPRYDILFEPMAIGPLTAKNRFYQVPHCNGGGYRDPSAAAAMRATKAEGGWGVIFTEQTEMHHSSEITPFIELRLWEDKDIPSIAKMAQAMKTHGALAGIQLAYSGINGPNMYTKEVPLAPSALPIRTFTNDPVQARAMDKTDIKNLRRWFVNAAKRSKLAGFDLICLYGAHGFGMNVIYHNRKRLSDADEKACGAHYVDKETLLREADHVVLVVPYSAESHHLIGAKEIALMKSTATLVNIARGGIVDDAALAAALKAKQIFAAGLDVYEGEPKVHPELLKLSNVVLAPHIASATEKTRRAMIDLAVRNLRAALAGKKPPSLINTELWKK